MSAWKISPDDHGASAAKAAGYFRFSVSCHIASGDRRRAVWFAFSRRIFLQNGMHFATSAALIDSPHTFAIESNPPGMTETTLEWLIVNQRAQKTRRPLSADLLIAFFQPLGEGRFKPLVESGAMDCITGLALGEACCGGAGLRKVAGVGSRKRLDGYTIKR